MFDMFLNSVQLFMKGKLFQNRADVFRKLAIGCAIGLILLVVLTKLGLPLWLAVAISSLICGAIQPYLFKDLKYA